MRLEIKIRNEGILDHLPQLRVLKVKFRNKVFNPRIR